MSRPITFRNVNAPDLRGAGQLLRGAQDSFNGAGEILSGIIKRRQELQGQNLEQDRQAEERGFRDFLGSFSTPEQLAAARESGAVSERLSRLDPNVRDRVRGEADAMLGTLRERATEAFDFGNTRRAQNDQAPLAGLTAGFGEIDLSDETAAQEGFSALLARAGQMREAGELSDQGFAAFREDLLSRQDNRVGAIRDETGYQRDEDAYQRSEARRQAVEAISGVIPKIVQGTGSERAARDVMESQIARAGDNLAPADRQALRASLASSFASSNGMTTAESRAAQTQGALLDRALQDARRPVSEMGIFDGDSPTDLSQAYEYIRTNAPEDDEASVDSFNSALKDFQKIVVDEGLATESELGEIPWGGISLQALKRAGATESWLPFDDADFTESDVLRELSNVFREYTRNRSATEINREIDQGAIVSRARLGLPRPTQQGN